MDSVSRLLNHVEEARQARNDDSVRLLDDVEGIRRDRQRACVRLLQELTPHLYAARAVDRELDRHLARRFNVFRYLRDDELGLSRIIADLLDPDGEHGQGATYLEAMLELLEVPLRSTATDEIRVATERGVPGGRRIDITADIPTDGGTFCLAFENKPYAGDQYRQCCDYLKFLNKEYGERFLLVYLPPRFRMPDDDSLPPTCRERFKDNFRVLPYVADDAPHGDGEPSDEEGAASVPPDSGADDAPTDGHARAEDDALAEYAAPADDAPPVEDNAPAADTATDHEATTAHADAVVGDGASLADWFGTCCNLSEAERLRWFLREARLYCQAHFGDSTMTDTEARYIREYLDQNPRHLHAAFAVHRAWSGVKHDVCRRFLEHLRDRVEERISEEMPKIREDWRVDYGYEGDKRKYIFLRVRRTILVESANKGAIAVKLESERSGPKGWYWGVISNRKKLLRKELLAALKGRGLSLRHSDDWWIQYEYVPRYRRWGNRVPELARELTNGGGKITDYYVNGFLNIARKAIPAIDEVELANQSRSAPDDS